MDSFTLGVYLNELHTQCIIALRAANDIDLALQAKPSDRTDHGHAGFWTALQAFLVASANISKLVWPAPNYQDKGKVKWNTVTSPRGDALRDALNVKTLKAESTDALKNKDLRNSFEHLDERLDDWASQPKPNKIASRNIMSAASVKIDISPSDYIANFDPDTWEVTFLGKKFPVRPLVAAVNELHTRVDAELEKRRNAR